MWRCEVEDEATEEDVKGHMKAWLKAARTVKGGERLQAFVYHPVAVNSTGNVDFLFVVVAPSFAEWGTFWDAYPDSAAAQIEDSDGGIVCPDSALWESVKVETE